MRFCPYTYALTQQSLLPLWAAKNNCECALKITKIQQENTFKHYNYLEEVLNYISSLVSKDVKDETLEDWYKVSLNEV